jgi:hypothetical protein
VIVTWEAGNPAPFDAAFKRARAALAELDQHNGELTWNSTSR